MFLSTLASVRTQGLNNYPQHIRWVIEGNKGQNFSLMHFGASAHSELIAHTTQKRVLFEFQKLSGEKNIKAVVREFEPIPSCEKSRLLVFAGQLRGEFSGVQQPFKKLLLDRDTFVKYYKIIRNAKGKRANGLLSLFEQLKSIQEIDPYQFVFCATVFSQLGILIIENNYVKINEKKSTELTNSSAYNMIAQEQ